MAHRERIPGLSLSELSRLLQVKKYKIHINEITVKFADRNISTIRLVPLKNSVALCSEFERKVQILPVFTPVHTLPITSKAGVIEVTETARCSSLGFCRHSGGLRHC